MRGLTPQEIFLLKHCSVWPREIFPMEPELVPIFDSLLKRGLVSEMYIQEIRVCRVVRIPATTPMGKLLVSICVTPV